MSNLNYDKVVSVAVGSSRRSTQWKNKEFLWSELAKRLSIPTRTQETAAEYKSLPKARRDEIKDVGGFVGGVLKGGRRKSEAIAQRSMVTLDLDSIPYGGDPWTAVTMILGCAAVLYSTHSHTEKAPRLRLVMPLSRPVSPDEYIAISRKVADDIGIDWCDDTTYDPCRLMYWPSVPFDSVFRYEVQDAPFLDADEQLMRYTDWTDQSQWPTSSRKADIMQRMAKKQGDPLVKKGIVGAFCRVYSIEDAIETFLPEVYLKYENDRYTFAGGSTSGGLVLYENGRFSYSHHGTDPASGKLCNSFDLVRLHLFGNLDDSANPGTPVNRLPSFSAMSDLAIEDESVRQNLMEERLKDVSTAFDDDEDKDWLKTLAIAQNGQIESTIDNALIILLNDPDLKGKYYYDEFKERPIVSGDLPWVKFENRTSVIWADSDDSGLRQILEKRYAIDSAIKIRDAVELAMLKTKRHPVKEYLESLEWDGLTRADTLFIDYLGAEDSVYTREVTRKALIGAVARIMEPGCKHDHMLVLVGPQGCRKSTTLAKLGKTWFSDSLYTLSGKDAYEQLQGYWLIEVGEMAAMRKAEIEAIKQFISKQEDSYRAAYARRTQSHPRQCAFFGTTNDEEFLRDPTGARRFWPVTVTDEGKIKGDGLTSEIVDQIWAEIMTRYLAGEAWYLSDEIEELARKEQAEHTESNGKQGLIEHFLETLLPKDWETWDLEKRLMFWTGGFGDEQKGTERRTKVCPIEIWQELFRGDPKMYSQAQAREISGILRKITGWKSKSSIDCGPIYGRQRGYVWDSTVELYAQLLE